MPNPPSPNILFTSDTDTSDETVADLKRELEKARNATDPIQRALERADGNKSFSRAKEGPPIARGRTPRADAQQAVRLAEDEVHDALSRLRTATRDALRELPQARPTLPVEQLLQDMLDAYQALTGTEPNITFGFHGCTPELLAYATANMVKWVPYNDPSIAKSGEGMLRFKYGPGEFTLHNAKAPNALVIVEDATPREPGELIPPPPGQTYDTSGTEEVDQRAIPEPGAEPPVSPPCCEDGTCDARFEGEPATPDPEDLPW